MKPVVGVFTPIDGDGTHSIYMEYVQSLDKAGAMPIIVGYTDDEESLKQLADICDGFCFTGGVDVDPSYYGEQMLPECGAVQDKRDSLEMRAIPLAVATGKPILGICRGAQVVNVALGGTLYQDIPSQLGEDFPHRQTVGRYDCAHSVRIFPNTPFAELTGAEGVMVNSFHHQAVKKVCEGLAVMAVADDGIVEALYGTGSQYIRLYQ